MEACRALDLVIGVTGSPHHSLREVIAEDGVTVRWIRTAATTIVSVAAAAGVLWAAATYAIEPRAVDWTRRVVESVVQDMRVDGAESRQAVRALTETVDRLRTSVEQLAASPALDQAPSWRFDAVENSITDGMVGGMVEVSVSGFRSRDCGVPMIDVWFVDMSGRYHRFVDVSILDGRGRGVALPVDPARRQELRFSARIPRGEGVALGRAQGYVAVSHPEKCPLLSVVQTSALVFRISAAR